MVLAYFSSFQNRRFHLEGVKQILRWIGNSVARLGDLLDFGKKFKAFGNN